MLLEFARVAERRRRVRTSTSMTKLPEKGLATTAMAALSTLDGGVGVPALIDLARTGNSGTRGAAVFWLGQSGDPRAFAALHGVIENPREDERIRAHAIFSMSHGDDTPDAEFTYLRGVYSRITSTKMKEAILMGMGEDESGGSAWLIEKARDTGEPVSMRKNALFWAGQKKSTPTKDFRRFTARRRLELREHAISSYSSATMRHFQRLSDRARDSEKSIASRALLACQKGDPRVTKMIGDRSAVTRQSTFVIDSSRRVGRNRPGSRRRRGRRRPTRFAARANRRGAQSAAETRGSVLPRAPL